MKTTRKNPGIPRLADAYEQKLRDRLVRHAVAAEQLLFDQSCHSVEEAAAAVGDAEPKDFVKNVCLLASTVQGTAIMIVAIVPAERRASRSKVKAALQGRGIYLKALPEMADMETILARTGYPAGGTPSFCYDDSGIVVMVDDRLQAADSTVFTGGGSERSLCEVQTAELVRVVVAFGGSVERISDKVK